MSLTKEERAAMREQVKGPMFRTHADDLTRLLDALDAAEASVESRMAALLDEVERPSPVPVGAPGSLMRRAWDLGQKLCTDDIKRATRIAEAEARAERAEAAARGHAYSAGMAEGGEEIAQQELARERKDHAETRAELRAAEARLAEVERERDEALELRDAAVDAKHPHHLEPVRLACEDCGDLRWCCAGSRDRANAKRDAAREQVRVLVEALEPFAMVDERVIDELCAADYERASAALAKVKSDGPETAAGRAAIAKAQR